MVAAEKHLETVNKKDASNRYLVSEDSDCRPEKMAPEMDAAKLCRFPAIMGQQSLCQKATVALEKYFYTYY